MASPAGRRQVRCRAFAIEADFLNWMISRYLKYRRRNSPATSNRLKIRSGNREIANLAVVGQTAIHDDTSIRIPECVFDSLDRDDPIRDDFELDQRKSL